MGKGSISRLFSDIVIFCIILYAAYCNVPEEALVGTHSMVAKIIVAIIVLVFLFLFDKYMYKEAENKQKSVRVKIRDCTIYALVYLSVYALYGLYCFNVL